MDRNAAGAVFFLDRAKTGRAGAGTLTPWSEKLLTDYLESLRAELLDNAPIFRTAGSEPGPKGGRRWVQQPYSTFKMDRDFREIRTTVFGPGGSPARRHAPVWRRRGRRWWRVDC
jgi:hypothetical protein